MRRTRLSPLLFISVVTVALALFAGQGNAPPASAVSGLELRVPYRGSHPAICVYDRNCDEHVGSERYGIDFAFPDGDQRIFSASHGTVICSGLAFGGSSDTWKKYGYVVVVETVVTVDGQQRRFVLTYAHLSEILPEAAKGRQVTPDTPLGIVGKTGGWGTVHLHFSVREGGDCQDSSAGRGPYGGTAVLPEPLVGNQEYRDIKRGQILTSDPSPVRPPRIVYTDTVTIESMPSAQLRRQFPVSVDDPGLFERLMIFLGLNSDAVMTVVAPNGTTYNSASPGVTSTEWPGEARVLSIPNPAPGIWEVRVDVIEANPGTAFDLLAAGFEGGSGDSQPPTVTLSVSCPVPGNDGWCRSASTIEVAVEDPDSPIDRTECRVNHSEWQMISGSLPLGPNGLFRVECRAIDASGQFSAIATLEVKSDALPPESMGLLYGKRDSSGVFRDYPTFRVEATDNLSGVASTTFDDGTGPHAYTAPVTIRQNGLHPNYTFASEDQAGNVEQPRSSGPFEIGVWAAITKNAFTVVGATTVYVTPDVQSNGPVSIRDNVETHFGRINYVQTYEYTGNISTVTVDETQRTNPVPFPLYTLLSLRSRWKYFNGPVTISGPSRVFNDCIYATGDVTLTFNGASGRLTIVTEGRIIDRTTASTLTAWDEQDGILYMARRGYTSTSTGATYTGVIYSYAGPVQTTATNTHIIGGFYGTNVEMSGVTTLTIDAGSAIPSRDHVLPLNVAVPPEPERLIVSSTGGGTIGATSFADEDILEFNRDNDSWSMLLDLSDVDLSSGDIDALERLGDGSFLMSFDARRTLTPIGTVEDADIVRFVPQTTGAITSGSFQMAFDASDVSLTTSDEDIDALDVLPNGDLLISTLGVVNVPGVVRGQDEDLLLFKPSSLGANTAGTWQVYFDGSDTGLGESSSEDVGSVWVDHTTGDIHLTTIGSFAVPGLIGDADDVLVCRPQSLGSLTSCTWGPGIYFDGDLNYFGSRTIDALVISR